MQLLLSLSDYENKRADAKKGRNGPAPQDCVLTVMAGVGALVLLEQLILVVIGTNAVSSYTELLSGSLLNRQILARHFGVDAVSCFTCAYLGYMAKHHVTTDLIQTSRAGAASRLCTYQPEGFRIALFFLIYQIKNLGDTIVWNDGPEFIFHHIFSILTAYGSMWPGCGQQHCVFFFGISEVSTAVLCILANFDDDHGVVGLGDAMPTAKIVTGGAFITCFIVCRCILWPAASYYFARDVLEALKDEGKDERIQHRRGWMKFFLVSLVGLSVLQIAWLGQIYVIGKEEVSKFLATLS